MAGDQLTCWAGTKNQTFKVKYCESDKVSTRFRQIEKLQIVKYFHARHDELIVVELTCVGVQSSLSAWCQLHHGDMYAIVHFVCCAPPFSLFCCPCLSMRLHSLLTGMVSSQTYGSQCTPSLARASFTGVLSESLHRFMRI